jgi:hypothetical protein
MINAREARNLTDNAKSDKLLAAIKWAEQEMDYLEQDIMEAINNGEYSTTYWWGNSLLREAKVSAKDAKAAFEKILGSLGYHTSYGLNVFISGNPAFEITISWEDD